MVFGNYEWRILDTQWDRALIITESMVELRAYHDTPDDITWADCRLREYLNGEFYDKFNAAEKEKIISVTNKNPGNPWYGTNGGGGFAPPDVPTGKLPISMGMAI